MSRRKRSQSQDQPAPFKGEFSFVNKDAGNISSKEHSAAVSWHVLNRYERWKRQEQAKKLQAAPDAPPSDMPPPPLAQSSTDVRASSSARPRLGEQGQLTFPFRDSAATTSSLAPNPWSVEYLSQSSSRPGAFSTDLSATRVTTPASSSSSPAKSAALLSDAHYISTGAVGYQTPIYDSTPPHFHPLFSSLISFGYEFLIPHAWPNEIGRNLGTYGRSKSVEDLPNVESDPCYTNAYLALLAIVMASILEDEALALQARSFSANAMYELRQRVSVLPGNYTLGTLKAVLRLFSFETAADNTAIARSHLKMLRNLVNANGGIFLLDPWFREELISCDVYFALKYETRPLFPASDWTPGPMSAAWRARLISAGMLGEHAARTDASVEHPTLKSIITDLRELFEAEEYINSHDLMPDDQLLQWRRIRLLDIVSRIADHRLNVILYGHLYANAKVQTVTCNAIALMTALVSGTPEPVRFGQKLIKDLQQRIFEAEEDPVDGFASEDTKLRLWAYYVGGLAERTHPVSAEDLWFASRYEQQHRSMELRDWPATRSVLRSFLFSAKLESELQGGRPARTIERRKGLYDISSSSWREPEASSFQTLNVEETFEEAGQGKGKERED